MLALALVQVGVWAAPPAHVDVLIGFKQTPGQADQDVVTKAGGRIKYTYHLVPAIAASVPETALNGLRHNPRVTVVEPDVRVYALDHATTSGDAELNNAWGVKHIGSGSAHAAGATGAGVKVAVIDTGIDYAHPDLSANYAGGYDFVNNDADPKDDNNHGTHVAGTIAAADNGSGVVGVAPGGRLYALKVLNASGSGSFSNVIKALEWAVANGIQGTNNSYGSGSNPGTLVQQAFDNSAAAGMVHVAAAGNSGNRAGKGDNIGYPAKYESVIAVTATDSNNKRASFSSTGPDAEIAAPGVSIRSTVRGGGYANYSGTSMASPHVAGVAALVLGKGVADGNANGLVSDEVRALLQSTADDLGTTGKDNYYGYGLVDADGAIAP